MERLWTPWRMQYVSGGSRSEQCIFCSRPSPEHDEHALILFRDAHAFVIMNLYPYNTAHVMVVPARHVANLWELSPEENRAIWDLVPWVTAILKRVLRCEGFNIGLNLGSVAGAGVSDHLHVHVVPRWEGDANFMPILANTMVLPELIPVTYAKLRAEMELFPPQAPVRSGYIAQAGAIPVFPDDNLIALRKTASGEIVLPKGHVEPDEAAWQTVIREVDEEMGIQATPVAWGGVLSFNVQDKKRKVAHIICSVKPGPDFEKHLNNDTVLTSPDDAVSMLTHASTREMLRSRLMLIRTLIGSDRA